jgi:uncharacterized Fe-S cluster-containing radical SAM superfamily protein
MKLDKLGIAVTVSSTLSPACLKSIQCQTFKRYEIVAVSANDCLHSQSGNSINTGTTLPDLRRAGYEYFGDDPSITHVFFINGEDALVGNDVFSYFEQESGRIESTVVCLGVEGLDNEGSCPDYIYPFTQMFEKSILKLGAFRDEDIVPLVTTLADYNLYVPRKISYLNYSGIKRVMLESLDYIFFNKIRPEFDISNVCDISCAHCSHYVQLRQEDEPSFIPAETVIEGFDRLMEVVPVGKVSWFALLGGEPTLHPDLEKIIAHIRSRFPSYSQLPVVLFTNGLGLLKNGGDNPLVAMLARQSILVRVTLYPQTLLENEQYLRLEQSLHRYQIPHILRIKTKFKVLTLFTKFLMRESPLITRGFSRAGTTCPYAYAVFVYRHGDWVFSKCSFLAYVYRFREIFPRLTENDSDYLALRDIKSMTQILKHNFAPASKCQLCKLSTETPHRLLSKERQHIRDEWIVPIDD